MRVIFLFTLLFMAMWLPDSIAQAQSQSDLSIPLQSQSASNWLSLKPATEQWLNKKKTITVGVEKYDTEPFSIIENSEYRGIVADYLSYISRILHIEIKIKVFDSKSEKYNALKTGQVDVIAEINSLQNSLSTSSGFYAVPFINNYPLSVRRLISSKKNNGNILNSKLGYIVGGIDPEMTRKKYPGIELSPFSNDKEALNGLMTHKIDGIVGDLVSSSYYVNQYHIKEFRISNISSRREFSSNFLFNGNNILADAFLAALSNMNSHLISDIFRRWGGGSVLKLNAFINLDDKDKTWLGKHRQVKIGVIDYFAPFSYFDDAGYYNGITSDIIDQLELISGLQFEIIKYDNITSLLNAVRNSEIDVAADVTPKPDHDNTFLYSKWYILSDYVLVTRKNNTAIDGLATMENKRLAILKGNFLFSWLQKRFPDIEYVEVGNIVDGYDAVKYGRVDAFAQPMDSADYYISRFYKNELRINLIMTDVAASYSFVFRNTDRYLLNIINASLNKFSPQELADIANRWHTDAPLKNPFWEKYQKIFYLGLFIFITVILLALVRFFYLHQLLQHKRVAEKKLNDQLTFLKTLINETPHPIYVRDASLRLTMCNSGYLNELMIKDLQVADICNSDLSDRAYAEPSFLVNELMEDYLTVFKEKKALVQDRTLIIAGCQKTIYHWIIPYSDSQGMIQGVIGGWIDISERNNLLQELSREKKRADEANLTKSLFIANISHEIRTPMNAILGMLELADRQLGQEHQLKNIISTAYRSDQHLLVLLGDVLDISRIEAGKFELKPEATDLNRLIATTISLFEESINEKNLELVTNVEQIDCDVYIDPFRFKQILTNLLSNTIKFSDQGKIIIRFWHQKERDGGITLWLSVEDQGIGIPLREQYKLFQPFGQASGRDKTSPQAGGTGLGLSICKSICQKMNGNITLTSIPEKGTRVDVVLDAQQILRKEQLSAGIPEKVTVPAEGFSKLHVLVVDDHLPNRQLIEMQLAHLGCITLTANNGLQALEQWLSHNHFDVIFTDVNMPGMNGYDLTRKIRELDKKVKIIGYTANAQEEERQRCLAVGMDQCLFKPISLDNLANCLDGLFPEQAYVTWQRRNQPLLMPISEPPGLIQPALVLKITGDDKAARNQLVATIVATNKSDLILLAEALAQPEPEAEKIYQLVHKIHGGAKLVGADALCEICNQIASQARQGKIVEQDYYLKKISIVMQQVNNEMEKLITREVS